MRILEVGRDWRWYYRVKHTCPRCKAVWMLEDGDPVDLVMADDGYEVARSVCPCCNAETLTGRTAGPVPAPPVQPRRGWRTTLPSVLEPPATRPQGE